MRRRLPRRRDIDSFGVADPESSAASIIPRAHLLNPFTREGYLPNGIVCHLGEGYIALVFKDVKRLFRLANESSDSLGKKNELRVDARFARPRLPLSLSLHGTRSCQG